MSYSTDKAVSYTVAEKCVSAVVAIAVLVFHTLYYLRNKELGFPSIGVDGPVYLSAAQDVLNSKSLLLEELDTPFWTPWYVIIAMVGAKSLSVFLLNLSLKFITAASLLVLGKHVIEMRWLRLAPAFVWLVYWPTFDYVIFFFSMKLPWHFLPRYASDC